jgi:ferritin-like metal-binding protein YciE
MRVKPKASANGVKKSQIKISPKSKKKEEEEEQNGFRKLFVDQIRDIYWAENALIKSLTKLGEQASSEELQEALEDHLEETKEHALRLERVFEELGLKAEGKKCEAMAGLIKEAEEIVSETEEGPVRDAGIIMSAQRIEHYEIATYGTLCTFAKILNEDTVLSILKDILGDEKYTDEILSGIAESSVNIDAMLEEEWNEE